MSVSVSSSARPRGRLVSCERDGHRVGHRGPHCVFHNGRKTSARFSRRTGKVKVKVSLTADRDGRKSFNGMRFFERITRL